LSEFWHSNRLTTSDCSTNAADFAGFGRRTPTRLQAEARHQNLVKLVQENAFGTSGIAKHATPAENPATVHLPRIAAPDFSGRDRKKHRSNRNVMALLDAKIIHIGIDRSAEVVYAFASRPENMPLWASGLASGLTPADDGWIAEGALGDIRIRFTPNNSFGVIDHTVVLPSGQEVFNALRVVPNGSGAEIMFTLLRQDGMSDAQFDADAAWVLKDLTALKEILEREG
jgi:hypothetical protein